MNVGVRGVHRVGDGAELLALQRDRVLGERHGAALPRQGAHVLAGHVHVAVFVAAGFEDAGHGQCHGARIDLQARGRGAGLHLRALRGRAGVQLAHRDRVPGLDVDRRGDLLAHEHLTRRSGPLTIHEPVRVHGVHGLQVGAARDVGLVVDGDGLVVERGGSDQGARGNLGGRGGHGLVRDGHVTGGGDVFGVIIILLLLNEPIVILSAIYHTVGINDVIYYLENYHITFFEQYKTVSLSGNIFPCKPRTSLGHHF